MGRADIEVFALIDRTVLAIPFYPRGNIRPPMGKVTNWWPNGGHEGTVGGGRSFHVSTLALSATLSAVALSGISSAHAAGSAHPDEWDRLLWIVLGLGSIVAAIVFAIMAVAIWRYREGSPYVRKEPSTHNFRLEAIWTTIPVILVTIVVVLSLQVLSTTEDIPDEGLRIEVIGRQFEWEFVYPDNTTSIDEVWVEEGQTVIFEIWSEDVIHSFFLPDFKLKVDAFPNYVDEVYIVAEPAGDYEIVCAEFCGDIHSEMLGTLHIFEKGASDKPYGPPPGEVPPPPEVEEVTIDIELREDGGPGAAAPWSISPSRVTVEEGAEVTLRVWNNGTEVHGFYLPSPYSRTITEIPQGEFRYLNFTADLPTRGILAHCPDDDHRVNGMKTTLVVEAEVVEGETGDGKASPVSAGTLFLTALVVLGVVLFLAVRKPRGARHEEHHVPAEEEREESQVPEVDEGETASGKDGEEGGDGA
jgi:cytochrome c oxidase subunit 2